MRRICSIVFLCVLLIIFCSGCGEEEGGALSGAPIVFPSVGMISFDRSSYYSTNSAALVTLVDADLTNTNMVSVQVASASDPVGITLMLTNDNGAEFRGVIRFSQANSVAGTTIKIANGDLMMLSYVDKEPAGVQSATAYWWRPAQYGLYNETYVVNKMEFDMPDADPDAGFILFSNTGTHALTTTSTVVRDGSEGKYGYLRNDAFFFQFANPRDLGVYQSGSLKFSIKATNNLMLKLEWTGGSAQVFIGDYATLDGSWQDVSVPISDFSGINMSCLDIAFGLHWWHATAVAHFWLDKIYLEN